MATTKTEVKQKIKAVKRIALKDVLMELEEQNDGVLTPEAVLEAARDQKSPLHKSFEWDDKVGGEKYRLMQARLLINSIRVEFVGERRDKYFNATIIVEDKPVHGYFPIERVMSDQEVHRAVLEKAIRELEIAQEKYNKIKELKGVINTKRLNALKRNLK